MLDFLGIGWIECAVLLVNCALLGGWPLLNLLALFGLRGRGLDSTTDVLWALLIVAVPFLGALAFWIV